MCQVLLTCEGKHCKTYAQASLCRFGHRRAAVLLLKQKNSPRHFSSRENTEVQRFFFTMNPGCTRTK